jgi:hypothetical protein
MLGATLQNLVARVTWRAGFVHPCYTYSLFSYKVSYASLFVSVTLIFAVSFYTLQK